MQANARMQLLAKANHCRYCCYRNETCRKHRFANQCVDQCGFAAFKLAYTGYVKSSFRNPRGQLPRIVSNGLRTEFVCQSCQAGEASRSVYNAA